MEYSIQKLSASKREFAFDVSKEEWADFINKAYIKTKGQYQIQGFRKGHVPMSVIEKLYGGKKVFFEDAADIAVQQYWQEALAKETDFEIIDNPILDIKEMSEDGFKFVVTVEVSPEFKLGKYTGYTIDKVEASVSDAEVESAVQRELQKHSRKVEIDNRAAQNGDTVKIDFSGSLDGVKFDGGTAEKFDLTLGSGSFVPGFEEQVVGMNIGDEKDIDVTFPKDYGADNLAGKAVVFKVKLHAISMTEVPALDDEFVKDVSDKNTVAEYKAELRADLEKAAVKRSEAQENDALMTEILKGTNIDIPEVMIREETDRMIEDLKYRIESQTGAKFADYLKYVDMTEEKLRSDRKEQATVQAKGRLVMDAIAKAEKITAGAEDVEAKFAEIAAEVGKSVEEYKKIVGDRVLPYIESEIVNDKLIAFLRANNTFKAADKKSASKSKETATDEKPAKKTAAKKTAAKKD